MPADSLFRLVQSDIERVLFDGPAIHKRVDEIAAQITTDYLDRELVVIAILTGTLMFMSIFFAAFLSHEIELPERG